MLSEMSWLRFLLVRLLTVDIMLGSLHVKERVKPPGANY